MFPENRLTCDDETGRMTLEVPDFEAADALAELTGLTHEDGYFDLGPQADYGLMRLPVALQRSLKGRWIKLGDAFERDACERSRPETFTVPSYTGGLR